MLDNLAGIFIQPSTKTGKCFKFLELRIGELEVPRHGAVGCPLRLAADTRNRLADIDSGQHAQFKQRRRQVYLPVRNGNQVGWNVGGNILRFGFDNRQRCQRSATLLRTQVRCALQQPRVDVKNITGKSFPAGRTAQQQRQFAIGARMMREVVINDQHIAALFHEIFRDAGRCIRCDVS